MDELVEDFLVETKDGLEILDNDLVKIEKTPEDKDLLGSIFRIMHTIKGTCGFLGLSRLESVAHACENILDMARDGKLLITPDAVSLMLDSMDTIREIIDYLEENEVEPEGDDSALIAKLNKFADTGSIDTEGAQETASSAPEPEAEEAKPEEEAEPEPEAQKTEAKEESENPPKDESNNATSGEGIAQDSDELQKIFDETETEVNVGQYDSSNDKASDSKPKEADEKPAEASSGNLAQDSDELQKIFDETEPVVNVGQYEKKAEKKSAPSTEAKSTPNKSAAKDKAVKEGLKADSKTSGASKSIRVNLDVLEMLMQQASELVLTRNQLMQILRIQENSDFTSALQRLNHITTELQEGVMKTRMQPVGNAWAKLPRIVRDLSKELGKRIDLVMIGEDTELDRQLLELIKDPLTHMVRNSADHGLEGPEERINSGKSEVGTIELKAYHGSGYIIIEISDDGRGIDPEKIKQKAIDVGLANEAELSGMSDTQILQYIFNAGFSTAEKITSVSGRGVGMDVVKNNIEKIGGAIDLKSMVGQGSTFTIKIPLTLAIMPILEVKVCDQKFAIPQINVMEVVKASNDKNGLVVERINDKPVLRLRERLMPLISLQEVLQLTTLDEGEVALAEVCEDDAEQCENEEATQDQQEAEQEQDIQEQEQDKQESSKDKKDRKNKLDDIVRSHEYIVVCEIGGYNFGVIVDEVFDTEEIVVKPVAPIIKNIDVYSGITILGDGSVILILDPNGLARTAGEVITGQSNSSEDKKDTHGEKISSFVVFRAGDQTPKVVPLELLSRLEEIDVTKIEYSRGRPVIQYRDNLMRLAKVDPSYNIPEEGIQELLVFAQGDRVMGLMVEEIIDIVKSNVDVKLAENKEGFIGSMVIEGKTSDVIDVSHYFSQTFGSALGTVEDSNKGKGDRVLLVDDSPFFRKFVPPEIESEGYEVFVASSAQEAINEINRSKDVFAAIVTDINMPGMNGKEFADLCRASEKYKNIPIIALSSNASSSALAYSKEELLSSFDAYISKTHHKDLISTLKQLVAAKKQEVSV